MRGRQRSKGGAPTYDVDKIFQKKLYEIEKILDRGEGGVTPLRSATVGVFPLRASAQGVYRDPQTQRQRPTLPHCILGYTP